MIIAVIATSQDNTKHAAPDIPTNPRGPARSPATISDVLSTGKSIVNIVRPHEADFGAAGRRARRRRARTSSEGLDALLQPVEQELEAARPHPELPNTSRGRRGCGSTNSVLFEGPLRESRSGGFVMRVLGVWPSRSPGPFRRTRATPRSSSRAVHVHNRRFALGPRLAAGVSVGPTSPARRPCPRVFGEPEGLLCGRCLPRQNGRRA